MRSCRGHLLHSLCASVHHIYLPSTCSCDWQVVRRARGYYHWDHDHSVAEQQQLPASIRLCASRIRRLTQIMLSCVLRSMMHVRVYTNAQAELHLRLSLIFGWDRPGERLTTRILCMFILDSDARTRNGLPSKHTHRKISAVNGTVYVWIHSSSNHDCRLSAP